MKTPFLCYWDYHVWRVAYIGQMRVQASGAHSEPLYEVVEKCRKCQGTRTSYETKPPRKIKA